MLNLSPQGVLFLRLVNIIYEKIEKMAGEDICFIYLKKKGEKRAAFESNVQTLSQNLNNSKTVLVYSF